MSAAGPPQGAKPAASGGRAVTLDVTLLGRDYKVACKPGEETELQEAVALLDRRMRDVRDGSKTSSNERVAVVAALNLAHELLRAHALPPADRDAAPAPLVDAGAARRRIASMRSAIEQLLPGQEKLL